METALTSLPASWRVQLPEFEGPLDLLLHLVRVNEVEITDIPIARVCDQFHETLQLMEEMNLDIAAEYVYEAALLIYLKSRIVLPQGRREDGQPAEDPRQELVQRLLEYRRLKEAAHSLAEIHSLRRDMWPAPRRPAPGADPLEGIDLGEVSLYDLLGALKTVLVRYDREHPEPWSVPLERYSVRDQLERLLGELDRARPFDLVADLRARRCRAEVVAAFLAVLELARLALVRLHQTASGEILLYRTSRELGAQDLEALET
ncbi:MAG: segregation and condensation protein A [Thermoanaerobaculia bacterium]